MIRLYLGYIRDLPDPKDSPALLELLPKDRVERALRVLSGEGRKQQLGAGLLLEKVLKKYGADPEEVFYDEKGKPRHDKVRFSLSHSGDLAALAVSTMGEVGCDVEKIREIPENVVRTLSEREQAVLNESKDERITQFFRFWTRRESYLKMTGEGLSGLKKVALTEDGISRDGSPVSCFFRDYDVAGYSLSVCSEDDKFDPLARIVKLG